MSAATAHQLSVARPRSGVLVDAAIASAVLAGSLAQLSHGGLGGLGGISASETGSGELDWTAGLLAGCSAAPLLAWRRAPWTVFALTTAASVLLGGLGYPVGLPLGPIAALYLLAASREQEEPWTRRSTGAALALFAAYLLATAIGRGLSEIELSHVGLAWAVAWFAGERTRLRREHIAELKERAQGAEREAERERRLAVAEERARIARDLHDSAGHAINVIAVRAGTARLRHHEEDPERGQATLEGIEGLARQTAAEIDQIVGALREQGSDGGEIAAPPGLASLEGLVAHHGAAGLDVTIATSGSPRPLALAVDRAAYRVLQEALTNAARHGAGAARVELEFGEAALALTIRNSTSGGSDTRSSGGHGLIGMRERATMLGGSFDAERVNGVFRARAVLPYGGPSA